MLQRDGERFVTRGSQTQKHAAGIISDWEQMTGGLMQKSRVRLDLFDR